MEVYNNIELTSGILDGVMTVVFSWAQVTVHDAAQRQKCLDFALLTTVSVRVLS